MIAEQETGDRGQETRNREQEAGDRRRQTSGLPLVVFCLLFPVSCLLPFLVGHGCHRDDIDHEPAAAPPAQVDAAADPGAKTSR